MIEKITLLIDFMESTFVLTGICWHWIYFGPLYKDLKGLNTVESHITFYFSLSIHKKPMR